MAGAGDGIDGKTARASSGVDERGAGASAGSLREALDEAIIERVLDGGEGLSRAATPSLQQHQQQPSSHHHHHHHQRVPSQLEDQLGVSFVEMDPSSRYGRFDEELGRGACKVVYKAFDTQEGREVAWNKVDLGGGVSQGFQGGLGDDDLGKDEQDRILAEIRVLKALKHKNIMSFYKWWYNEDKLQVNFISEMFASGTLRRYRKRHKHLGDDVLKQWGWQILSGLVYLHGHKPPIVHRDLKCDNIFINGADGVVKIGDLGLATMLHGRTAPQSVIGTPEFMAPELYEEYYDDRVDVYAFGMVMLELATMEYPYSECSNAAQIYRKVTLQVRPAGLQKVTCKELADFINTCIAPLEQRPRSRQLLKHPYFASIRNSLHPSTSELFLASGIARASGDGAGGRDGGPRSSSAALGRGQAPNSGGSSQSVGMSGVATVGSQLSRSMSASPAPVGAFHDAHAGVVGAVGGLSSAAQSQLYSQQSVNSGLANETVIPSELMRELVDSKAAAMWASAVGGAGGGSGSGTGSMTPPPSQRSGRGGLPSPPRERLPSPLGGAANGGDQAVSADNMANGGSAPLSGAATPTTGAALGVNPNPNNTTPGSTKRRKGISCRCAATNRCFEFAGKYREDRGKRLLSLRLKIVEPDETSRTIEFEFDMTSDTATNVASEMVGVLELSPEDAVAISEAMEAEISQLLSSLEGQASSDLAQAVGEFQHELSSALQHASSVDTAFGNSSVSISGGVSGGHSAVNSLDPPPSRLQPRRTMSGMSGMSGSANNNGIVTSGLSGLESMNSLHSLDSQRSAASVHSNHSMHSNHSEGHASGMSTPNAPSRSANPSPLYYANGNGSGNDHVGSNDNLLAAGSAKMQSNAEKGVKAQTPPGGSSRSSFEMRLSPRDGDLSRDSSALEARSLKKLYESLQQVSDNCDSPGATTKPPLPPSASSKQLSGQVSTQSLNSGSASDGVEDKPMTKEDKLQQAMNALKVVESRSLELLGGGCSKKGVPMKTDKKGDDVSLEPFGIPNATVTASSSHDSIDTTGVAAENLPSVAGDGKPQVK